MPHRQPFVPPATRHGSLLRRRFRRLAIRWMVILGEFHTIHKLVLPGIAPGTSRSSSHSASRGVPVVVKMYCWHAMYLGYKYFWLSPYITLSDKAKPYLSSTRSPLFEYVRKYRRIASLNIVLINIFFFTRYSSNEPVWSNAFDGIWKIFYSVNVFYTDSVFLPFCELTFVSI